MKALLDRDGDAAIPNGYIAIETEVDFLCHADDETLLLIRGKDLCDWAEMFYRSRSIPYREIHSAFRELVTACTSLTKEQATEIYTLLGEKFELLPKPVRIQDLLQALFPQRMWFESPSIEHGAAWLSWLVTQPLSSTISPLLTVAASQWRVQALGVEEIIYTADDTESATQILLSWLGIIDQKKFKSFDEFPQDIPQCILEKAKAIWKHELISTRGRVIESLLTRRSPKKTTFLATELAVAYFTKHPRDLTEELLDCMKMYLTRNQQLSLSRFIEPSQPSSIPVEPALVKSWYRTEYLPYRLWQEQHGDGNARRNVWLAAHDFALWYLEQYAKGLVGGPLTAHLSFNLIAELANQPTGYSTLVVVLDGLHVSDAQYVLGALQKGTNRLTVVLDELTFAPLPTVTEFCKDALFKGTSPVNAPKFRPLGNILPENIFPTDSLQEAKPGQLYLWRVQEPDNTYHIRNKFQTLHRDIESQLDGIANKIIDIVDGVTPNMPLRIVITTDHGRLLAKSDRSLAVPIGMEPHGRAAWGQTDERTFPACGYIIEDEEIVYLHRDRFCLPCDVALLMTEKAFRTIDNRTGTELYAHGGLYPEEVIIPWLILIRDLQNPDIQVHISGKSRAGTFGQVQLKITSLSEFPLRIVGIILTSANGREFKIRANVECPANYESIFSFDLDMWPTQKEVQNITALINLQLPDGRTFSTNADISLESEEMYSKDQNILEGLDL